jgi:riboflavin biosynthesis pyrimidine reductase
MPEMATFRVDRLWPHPMADLDLEVAVADYRPPAVDRRPSVTINMVTSIDGRAQRTGTAEGLAGRGDRRLMQLYRAAHDAIAGGAGTLRAAGLWLRLTRDLAERRRAAGLPPQPIGVLVAGSEPVATDARWFTGDEPRIVAVGSANATREVPPGTELIRATTPRPEPGWLLEQLAVRGVRSLLLEGGPHLNAAFLAAGLIDELCWTIGAHLLGTDGLPMIAPVAPAAGSAEREPMHGTLTSVMRHDDELFLRYRFGER